MTGEELIKALRVSNRRALHQQGVSRPLLHEAADEIVRLRAALNRIAERTGSDDPCRWMVQLARETLSK